MKYILSIDAGVVQTQVATTFLSLLETDLNINLYEQFDIFSATSFSSWIISSIMCKQDINQIINQTNFKNILKQKWHTPISKLFKCKYDQKIKYDFISKNFPNIEINKIEKEFYIPIYNSVTHETFIYNNKLNSINIYDMLDTSSATPYFYDSINNYTDGILCAYTPSIIPMFNHINEDIKLLSIGINSKKPQVVKYGGAIDYYQHESGFMMSNSQANNQICQSILGNNCLRIDFYDLPVEINYDDCSASNFDYMKNLGEKMFLDNKENLKLFFK